jgi:hypothetical protein
MLQPQAISDLQITNLRVIRCIMLTSNAIESNPGVSNV